jgi:hypothetical protein
MPLNWYLTSEGWLLMAMEYERKGLIEHVNMALACALTLEAQGK